MSTVDETGWGPRNSQILSKRRLEGQFGNRPNAGLKVSRVHGGNSKYAKQAGQRNPGPL